MGKASSVVWTFAAAMLWQLQKIQIHLKASAAANIPEAQPITQIGKVLPSSTTGLSHLN